MSENNGKREGGMAPVVVLLGLMLLILAYGIQKGFLNYADPAAGKEVRLTVAIGGDPTGAYQDVIDRFKASHPNVGVDLRIVSGPKYYQKLLVMMASGDPPDLMWMGLGFGEFAQRGAFLDVEDFIRRDIDVKRFLPQASKWYRSGGRQLGIPFALDVGFIIYNKDIFDELGLAYPTDDWDYDQFLELAKRLTIRDDHGRIRRYGFYGSLPDCLFGAQFISDDGSHATCDSPEMIEALKTNNELVNQYHVAPTPQQTQSLDRYFLFSSGRAAMMQAFTWDLTSLHRQAASVRWGYVLNPKVKVRAEWASSQAMLISSRTPHPEEAWQLCKGFLAPGFQKAVAGWSFPSDLKVARELAASGIPEYDHLPTLLKAVGRLVADPRVAHFSEAQQIFTQACQSVWTGQDSPGEAMERASRMIDRMLQLHRRFGS